MAVNFVKDHAKVTFKDIDEFNVKFQQPLNEKGLFSYYFRVTA